MFHSQNNKRVLTVGTKKRFPKDFFTIADIDSPVNHKKRNKNIHLKSLNIPELKKDALEKEEEKEEETPRFKDIGE